jgi:Uma2 family endonuclease
MVQILTPDVLPEIRMTVDEYLTADLPEGHRYELVEGVVQMSPVPGVPHELILARLHRILGRYADRYPERIGLIATRSAVANADRRTVREPDVSVYEPHQVPDDGEKSWKQMRPLLIIEVVSPGQEKRDYEEKRRDYWEAGVAEYWIIDPQRRTLTVLTRAADAWMETVFDEDGTYRAERLPGLEVSVAQVLHR